MNPRNLKKNCRHISAQHSALRRRSASSFKNKEKRYKRGHTRPTKAHFHRAELVIYEKIYEKINLINLPVHQSF